MGNSNTPKPASGSTPVSYRWIFIGNLSKQCSVKNLVNHLKSMDIAPGKVTCLTSNESKHRSYKVEIPVGQVDSALNSANWLDGINVRPFRENEGARGRSSESSSHWNQSRRPFPAGREGSRNNFYRGPRFNNNRSRQESRVPRSQHPRNQHSSPYQQPPMSQQQPQQPPVYVCQPPAWNGWPPLPSTARPQQGPSPPWYSSFTQQSQPWFTGF